jgi:cell filamentation protein
VADDPYVYPGTSILRNRFGIRDRQRLDELEAEWSFIRLTELLSNPEPGNYDLDHLARLHRRIFGDVYPWAGEIRSVPLAKTDLFALPQYIASYGDSVFSQLRTEDQLTGLPKDRFVDRVAFYFSEINALHPFREGNGRTQRAFLKQLGRQAGWDIEWRFSTPDENLAMSVAAMRGDLGPATEVFGRIVTEWER